ncbi:MAG: helix-turn-helix transcriptional regulator [Chloroflexota bacterium]
MRVERRVRRDAGLAGDEATGLHDDGATGLHDDGAAAPTQRGPRCFFVLNDATHRYRVYISKGQYVHELRQIPDVPVPGDCSCVGAQPRNFILPCLLLLLREGAAHGYDLVDRLNQFGFASEPPVEYRNLRRMESEALVRSSWDTTGKGPARRVYELTEQGERNLDAWTLAVKYQRDVLNCFLVRHAAGFQGWEAASQQSGAGG